MPQSPLTRSQNVSWLRSISAPRLVEEWRRVFGIDITSELQGVSTIEHYRCDDSGLEFFLPPGVAGSPLLYQGLQRFEWYYSSHGWELNLAARDVRPCRHLLEVGSGAGAFVEQCQAAGIEAIGLETNPVACQEANAHGIPTECLALSEYVRQGRPAVDAVCAFQVLEHLADPLRFFEDCEAALRRRGLLLLSVPNADGYLRHCDDILDRPPHHMTRWSPATFRRLEHFVPFRVEALAREPLAPNQVARFLDAQGSRFRARRFLGRVAFNRCTLPALNRLLRVGFRNLFAGHSLYIRMRRLS